MSCSCRNGDYVVECERHIELPKVIAPPGNHGAIGFECERKACPCSDSSDIALCLNGYLTFAVVVFVTPCSYVAGLIEYVRNRCPGGDVTELGVFEAIGNRTLPLAVIAPHDECVIVEETKHKVRTD